MRVFLASPWIPPEWIRAHGLEARGIWFDENFRGEMPTLAAGVCAFAEQVVRFAESQPDAAVIFTTACDQLRRGFDAATFRRQPRAFLFNLPATQTPAARQIYRSELDRLGRFMVELGGSVPSVGKLREEMLRADAIRDRLRAAAPVASAATFAEAVRQFFDHGTFSTPAAAPQGDQVPLALVGGPLGVADWHLFDAIESAGGRVALNATKTGERSLCPQFESNEPPFDALVAGYFENFTAMFLRPNTRLYSWLKPLLQSREVRGIVLWHFTNCDLWRAEAQTMREVLRLPVLLLEANETTALSPRDHTRLQAFVETLK